MRIQLVSIATLFLVGAFLVGALSNCTKDPSIIDEKRPTKPGGGHATGGAGVGGTGTGGTSAVGGMGTGALEGSGGVAQGSGGVLASGGIGASSGGAASGGTASPGGGGSGAGTGGTVGVGGATGATGGQGGTVGGEYAPPLHAKLPLTPLRAGLGLYNPHQARGATVKGSTHTHAAPDHSGIDPDEQEARLRDLKAPNAHDFVFLTAHNFVSPSPNVPGILHMFGVEVYTKQASGAAPHMLALLPNGSLANVDAMPFGYYSKDVMAASTAIRNAGGLPILAHPLRYPIPDDEVKTFDERLWGIEIMSSSGVVADNLEFADDFLSRGKYACLTAGGDIHDEDYSLTRGYIVVSVTNKPPTMGELFSAVQACNFFACGVQSEDSIPLDPPDIKVEGGKISITLKSAATVRFIGHDGTVLKQVPSATSADYSPQGNEQYVRIDAEAQNARCYSQPLWLVPG